MNIIDQVIEQFNAINNLDFTTLPNFMFIMKLREALIANDFFPEFAEDIVSLMSVNINCAITEQQLDDLVTAYCTSICKIADALEAVPVKNSVNMLKHMVAQQLKLELK